MRSSITISVLILIASSTGNHCFSQHHKEESKPGNYKTVQWNAEDGLSERSMHTMIKDAKGFLWVGSYHGQLSRFDGAMFINFIPDPHKRTAINTDIIHSFKEDKLGNIWIGTARGLSRYDIRADTFTNWLPLVETGNPESPIDPFWSTNEDIYCKEPGSLITAINLHTLVRRVLLHLPEKIDSILHWNTNKTFFDSTTSSIWMLSSYKGRDGATALDRVFLDGKYERYSWPCLAKNKTHRHGAEDMQYDPGRNSIWINSGEGLLEFSLADKQFRNADIPAELSGSKNYDRNVGIDIDRYGRIWFTTYLQGIFIYDPETTRVRPVFPDPELQKKNRGSKSSYLLRPGWNCMGLQLDGSWYLSIDPPRSSYTFL